MAIMTDPRTIDCARIHGILTRMRPFYTIHREWGGTRRRIRIDAAMRMLQAHRCFIIERPILCGLSFMIYKRK